MGQAVNKKNLNEIRKKTGYVFQDSDSQLFMSTVFEDVAFGPRNYGVPEPEVKKRVMEALNKVHIEELRDRQIYRMSGGQKKLASIATILSMEPEIILLDEPSIALDPKNRRNLIGILNEMPETKIIASHDLDMILDTCDETILLADGSVVSSGPTEEILKNKELLEKYGLELPLCMQGQGQRGERL
jgi:cobalt/nickel transport system ATP-binding protein